MTIWISQELPLYNFEHLHILCAFIGHPCEKLWQFEFLESFSFSIWGISIYHAPNSDFRVKSYDHLNFWRASVVQFRASRYMMRLNRTSEWKVMTIFPLSNFECLDILCPRIGHPREKLWPLEFSRASVAQFRASRYVMGLSRTFEWKVMMVWIFRELSLINFEVLDILCAWIGHLTENL